MKTKLFVICKLCEGKKYDIPTSHLEGRVQKMANEVYFKYFIIHRNDYISFRRFYTIHYGLAHKNECKKAR